MARIRLCNWVLFVKLSFGEHRHAVQVGAIYQVRLNHHLY